MSANARAVDTGSDTLLCEVRDRVAVVTLNRPEAKNALSMELKEALYRIVPRLGADSEVGCVLLTGAGSAFCAGGDTKAMQRDGNPPSMEDRQRQLRWEHQLPRMLHELPKPTLCALPGAAAGAGFSIALACDLRIASEKAFLLTSFVRVGLSGDYGGSWFLTRLVGPAKAREIYFLSERLGVQECFDLGLFNRVVPHDELAGAAFEMAKQLASGPPISMRFMKENLNRALHADLATCMDYEADRMVRGAMTDDYREAVAAFSEKRKPAFKGR
jgi:enoyl-CoA hydratase/carnithine racemase